MSATILKYPDRLAVHMGNAPADRSGLASPSAWRGASVRHRCLAAHVADVTPKIDKPRGLPWGTIIAATVCGICIAALAWSWARWLL